MKTLEGRLKAVRSAYGELIHNTLTGFHGYDWLLNSEEDRSDLIVEIIGMDRLIKCLSFITDDYCSNITDFNMMGNYYIRGESYRNNELHFVAAHIFSISDFHDHIINQCKKNSNINYLPQRIIHSIEYWSMETSKKKHSNNKIADLLSRSLKESSINPIIIRLPKRNKTESILKEIIESAGGWRSFVSKRSLDDVYSSFMTMSSIYPDELPQVKIEKETSLTDHDSSIAVLKIMREVVGDKKLFNAVINTSVFYENPAFNISTMTDQLSDLFTLEEIRSILNIDNDSDFINEKMEFSDMNSEDIYAIDREVGVLLKSLMKNKENKKLVLSEDTIRKLVSSSEFFSASLLDMKELSKSSKRHLIETDFRI